MIAKNHNGSLNRIKIVLAETQRSNNWLAEQLEMTPSSISKWCRNKAQPSLETLFEIAEILDVEVRDLIVPTKIK